MADESLTTAVVKRLRNQPFLFVLGIAVLLIGLLSSGAGFGTPEFRIILAMIGTLAFLVVIGYYVLAVLRLRSGAPEAAHGTEPARPTPSARAADPAPATLSARAADPAAPAWRAPEPSSTPAGPARATEPAPTYSVSAPGSVIGAIGSNAKITMNNPAPPAAAPAPPAPAASTADEIDRARRNLARLESKRALYTAGTEPRELLGEIAHEQRRIAELTSPGRDAARPDGGRSG